MELGDEAFRDNFVHLLSAIDEASKTFDELVLTSSRRELVDRVAEMNHKEARRLLLAAVLVEQQRRIHQPPTAPQG